MEVVLTPLTGDNIDELMDASQESGSDFYPLPGDEAAAVKYLQRVEIHRYNKVGEEFLAHEIAGQQLVGGGQVALLGPECTIAYWVAAPLRRRGYGKELVAALEIQAAAAFPFENTITAHIDQHNIASRALAESAGFKLDEAQTARDGILRYAKSLHLPS